MILTSDLPKTIIIDEPNSFLHPGAAKKLIEILKEHSQHQFIISTHSPSTLAACNPKTIHVLKQKDAESYIESVDITEANNQQIFLAEIGAKLSDVFGADNILWVEGKTEEICFPKIVEKMTGVSLQGTSVLSVINTGDFLKKKNADLIFSIYEKLSKGRGLIPPALGFIFDSEKLSFTEKDDLIRRSNGKVAFLERRMFENYIINPKAINSTFSKISELSDLKISESQIEDWLKVNKWEKEFIERKFLKEKKEEDWLKHVDGARILTRIFSDITKQRLRFDKIKHGVPLCEWIIQNSLDDLKEVEEVLASKLRS